MSILINLLNQKSELRYIRTIHLEIDHIGWRESWNCSDLRMTHTFRRVREFPSDSYSFSPKEKKTKRKKMNVMSSKESIYYIPSWLSDIMK